MPHPKLSGVVSYSAMAAGGLLLLALVAHWPAVHADICWDDNRYVIDNTLLHEPGGLWRIWFDFGALPDYYPLTFTTWWLEYRLTKLNLGISHAVNVLLHALSCVVLWRVLRRSGVVGAWFTAALFAVHPVTVESVAWLAERKNVLSMLLCLGSALLVLRFEDGDQEESASTGNRESDPRRWVAYVAALLVFILAMLAKSAVAPMPVVMLLLAWWRRGGITRADLTRMVPFFVVAAALGLATIVHEDRIAINTLEPRSEGVWSRLAASGWCVWFYLFKVALPVGLSMIYPRWDVDPTSVVSWLPLLGLIAAAVAAWLGRTSGGRMVLAALGAYVAMLLPTLGVFDNSYFDFSLVADHFQYFALPAPLCLTVAVAVRLTDSIRSFPAFRSTGVAIACVVLVVLSTLTWHRSSLYRKSRDLWFDTLQKNPDSVVAHMSLAAALTSENRLDEAIVHYRKALSLKPNYVGGHVDLGAALAGQGDVDQAIVHYRKALAIDPDAPGAHYNLGVALQARKLTDDAIVHYRRSLRSDPRHARAQNNLGVLLRRGGHADEAIEHLRRAVEITPDLVDAHVNLGVSLASRDELNEAADCFRRALQIQPVLFEAHINLANTLLALGQVNAAIDQYQRTLQLRPDNTLSHLNLGVAFAGSGRIDEAMHHVRETLRINPDLAAAQAVLDRLLEMKSRELQ